MAKKRAVSKAKVLKTPEKIEIKTEVKKEGAGKIVAVVLVLLTIVTFIEIFGFAKINKSQSKKPTTVAHWSYTGTGYTGLTSMSAYGSNLYVVDSARGTVMQFDEMTGKFINKYSLPQGVFSVAQYSNGNVLLLSRGNTVYKYTAGPNKIPVSIVLEGCTSAYYISADSKDNLLVVDGEKKVVIKYDANLKKIGEYGKDLLLQPRRVFVGPNDSMYVLDSVADNKILIKIFDANGTFKKKFKAVDIKGKLSGFDSLAITPKGEIYINNVGGDAILCYDSNGKLLGKFITSAEDVRIANTSGIAGGMDGKFIIASYEMQILQNINY